MARLAYRRPLSALAETQTFICTIDPDRILGRKLSFKNGLGQRILDLLLNGPLERTRAKDRVEAGAGNFDQSRFVDHQSHVPDPAPDMTAGNRIAATGTDDQSG